MADGKRMTVIQHAAEIAGHLWESTPPDHVARLEVAQMLALGILPSDNQLSQRWKCSRDKVRRLVSEAEGMSLVIDGGEG